MPESHLGCFQLLLLLLLFLPPLDVKLGDVALRHMAQQLDQRLQVTALLYLVVLLWCFALP